ncbi:MAG: VWA domain-containing protein [Limibacillus sp.]
MKCTIRGAARALLFSASALAVATAGTALPRAAQAATNFLVMMDVSNSMWGQIESRPKIDIAREALEGILAEVGGETELALMAYGHRSKDDCQDVELLVPFGAGGADQLRASIAGLQPTGKTPIAYSLEQTLAAFEGRLEENNNVVLISDGIETCEGDPCAVAATLRERGVNLRVHVVGFDVDEEAKAQLGCIAEKGGGAYYDAANAGELNEVLEQVRVVAEAPAEVMTDAAPQVAQADAPMTDAPMTEVFFDDFESDNGDVAAHWLVQNPDPEAYIVEAGELLMLSSQAQSLAEKQVSNLMLLDQPLPRGDWVITAQMTVEFQTGQEDAFIGVYDSGQDYMVGILRSTVCGHWSDRVCGQLVGYKQSPRDTSSFSETFWNEQFQVEGYDFGTRIAEYPNPLQVRLKKEGRTYTFGLRVPGYEEVGQEPGKEAYNKPPYTDWFDLEAFTVLRLKGQLALGFTQRKDQGGESVVLFDWVKIETP